MTIASVSNTWAGTGTSSTLVARPGYIGFDLSGTFVGTIVIERQAFGSSDWIVCTTLGSSVSFTAPASENLYEGVGAKYRMNCTAYTSGSPVGRLQQNS